MQKNIDDFLTIASCVYNTDSFIYPAAFGTDLQKATYAISRLMGIKGGLFNPDNFIVATYEEKIYGIMLYNKEGVVWNQNECINLIQGIIPSIENFNYVSDKYFAVESIAPPKGNIELIACCVIPEVRNMGVGKHMINWLIEQYPKYTLTLDVLADNIAAISVYKRYGFKIIERFKGFSLEESTRPDCYRMIRESDDFSENLKF